MTYIEGKAYNKTALRVIRGIAWDVVARLVEAGTPMVEVTMELSHNPEMGTSFANMKFGIPGRWVKESRHLMVTMEGDVTLLNAMRAPKWDGTPDYRALQLPGDYAAIHAPTYR